MENFISTLFTYVTQFASLIFIIFLGYLAHKGLLLKKTEQLTNVIKSNPFAILALVQLLASAFEWYSLYEISIKSKDITINVSSVMGAGSTIVIVEYVLAVYVAVNVPTVLSKILSWNFDKEFFKSFTTLMLLWAVDLIFTNIFYQLVLNINGVTAMQTTTKTWSESTWMFNKVLWFFDIEIVKLTKTFMFVSWVSIFATHLLIMAESLILVLVPNLLNKMSNRELHDKINEKSTDKNSIKTQEFNNKKQVINGLNKEIKTLNTQLNSETDETKRMSIAENLLQKITSSIYEMQKFLDLYKEDPDFKGEGGLFSNYERTITSHNIAKQTLSAARVGE